jgi:tRNA(Ile)-lysidine synthase
MLQAISKHLTITFQLTPQQSLLLAVSGGLDSMVLVHLFTALKYKIAIAHCNFGLRETESDGDADFVKKIANTLNVPYHEIRFETQKYAEAQKISTQMAARELRYNWFNELCSTEGYSHVLTAHHADDNLETVLINITRGTGLEGLLGIPAVSGKILRPLLSYSRAQILAYAQENKIIWREDSSNTSVKYLRNKIRHRVIPILKEINPSLLDSFEQTVTHLKESKTIVDYALQQLKKEILEEKDNHFIVHLEPLKKMPNPKAYLYPLLQSYGFTSWNDIAELLEAQTGKTILSAHYQILKNRNTFILSPIIQSQRNQSYEWSKNNEVLLTPIQLIQNKVNELGKGDKKTIYVDAEKLQFPLRVRKWQEGDYFYPLGMNKQKKKVSKYFKDEKLSLLQKEATWLLCSDQKIVWIIGQRPDERFKVSEQTKEIVKIVWHD